MLLDSREVAALLDLGRTNVFQMMAKQELPVVRIGRVVRVPREALASWLVEPTRLRPPTALTDSDRDTDFNTWRRR